MEKKKSNKTYKVKFVKGEGTISCITDEKSYYATDKITTPLEGEEITYQDKLPYKRFTILKKLKKWLGKI